MHSLVLGPLVEKSRRAVTHLPSQPERRRGANYAECKISRQVMDRAVSKSARRTTMG